MAEQALVVDMGRKLTARLLKGDAIDGISHCALGEGDATFTDPNNPPAPTADQTTLKSEFTRKERYKTAFLVEDPEGNITVDGTSYSETETDTDVIGVFFRFDDYQATSGVIKEIGFFGGTVEYVENVTDNTAVSGIYHEIENPGGEVLAPGYLYEVRNIPDYNKDSHTMLELIAIVKLAECPAP